MKLPRTFAVRRELLKLALAPGLSANRVSETLARCGIVNYTDVTASETPIDLVSRLPAPTAALPDFAKRVASPDTFVPPGMPAFFNSEPSVARFLAQLIVRQNPAVVVELGCFVGWATVHLALALKACGGRGRLFSVDCSRECLTATENNLQRHGVQRLVTTLQGFSLDDSVLQAVPPKVDLVFIDSSHEYPDTKHEIETYSRRLSPGGCLVLHDAISFGGVRRSIREVADRFTIHTFATEKSNGVAVLTPR